MKRRRLDRYGMSEYEREQRELDSAYLVLSIPGGVAAQYDHAVLAIWQYLSGDSLAYWERKYAKRLEELWQS